MNMPLTGCHFSIAYLLFVFPALVYAAPAIKTASPHAGTLFPDATMVGYAGSTITGDEAAILATAPAAPIMAGPAYPLVAPQPADVNSNSWSESKFNMEQYWGNLSPFRSIDSAAFGLPGASERPPEGCNIVQLHLLHRHGARYPTSGSAPEKFAAKIYNTTVNGTGIFATGALAFLNSWTYKLGAELLTPFGRKQLFDLGVGIRMKYGELLNNSTHLPVFRTTSEERMVQSAQNFAAGFFGIPEFLTNYHQEIIIESPGYNNTLSPVGVCANINKGSAATLGSQASAAWAEVYLPPAVSRLQNMISKDGPRLDVDDALAMQMLCAYETVALGFSSFCRLFTEEEWRSFDYLFDLTFWYGNGPGNPTSAALGVGYVQELVSRLTKTPLDPAHANSTTNSTLDANNVTFPLDQSIYVDATHDTDISAFLVTLNFTTLSAEGPLPLSFIPKKHAYKATHISPFAATLAGQVLSCPAHVSGPSSHENLFFRWILNDGVVPQTGVAGCPENKDGLCPLETYVAAMKRRVTEIDFAFDCNGNYSVPLVSEDTITDGRPPTELKAS